MMDAGETRACDRCGQPNPAHGLWCGRCGSALSWPMKAPAAALQDDKAIRAAIDLYARVLADLEGLAQRSEIASPAYDTIKEFYSGRLTAQQAQEAARQRALTIDTCIWAARSLAHTTTRNRLSEALATLDDVLRRIPDEPVLQEMAREVRAQIEKRDQARRAAQAARELLVAEIGRAHV